MKKIIFCVFVLMANITLSNATMTTTATAIAINQPAEYQLYQHIVMPGEALEQIARTYYGSEDLTLILVDNQFLQYRARYASTGILAKYMIYPGDKLWVRNYDMVSETTASVAEPTLLFISEPWFWILAGVLFLLVIAVCILIGRSSVRNNVPFYGGYFLPNQHSVFMQPVQPAQNQQRNHNHTHTHVHQHNYAPIQVQAQVTKVQQPVVPAPTDGKKD